jgi:uncharacterized protein (DUF2267 family)
MKHDQFIGKVQARAREADDLAAQLPEEIDRHLIGRGAGERIKLSEFYDRVAEGLGVDKPEAAHRARAVVSVLAEAVTPGELDDVRAQLPEEWRALFESNPESRIGREHARR